MRKLTLLTGFFLITPIFLLFNLIFLAYLSYNKAQSISLPFFKPTQTVAYAALPSTQNVFAQTIEQKDVRVELIRQFLNKYQSPLETYSDQIVATADAYGIDHRLLPAIAMQESNLCKKIPKDSYNCWGFGIYGSKVTRFNNYNEAIEVVSKTLAKNYIAMGLETPEQIMSKYTPSNTGDWARSVSFFMNVISSY